MSQLRRLAGQTAIYGLSTIFGRLLNYALVPFYTYIYGAPKDFGLNTEFYAYISFLNVIFTYGMETGLFHFSARELDKNKVYSTALISLFCSTVLLTLPILLFSGSIAGLLDYTGHADFIIWSILIVATDAAAAIPFAKLRESNRARRFAALKLTNIFVNLLLNFFFIGACKHAYDTGGNAWLASLYNPSIGIGYAFIANLIANAVVLLLLIPDMKDIRFGFDSALWKRMMVYSLPLLVVGLAGMVNETMDRILLKYLLPHDISKGEVGIYGACYKISILMTIFIQAFRYAAEPFFFSRQKDADARDLYGKVMTYFVIACAFIFLGTMQNISWIQYFIGKQYRVGMPVVPILLLANLCLGIYFNLSIWYKLASRTTFGMWLTLFGAVVTLTLNFIWIPSQGYFHSYTGSAWATLICYASMMVLSYVIGQREYKVNYDVPRALLYLGLAIGLYFAGTCIGTGSKVLDLVLKNALLLPFIGLVLWLQKDLRLLKMK